MTPPKPKSKIRRKLQDCNDHLDLDGPNEISHKAIQAAELASTKSSVGPTICNDSLNAVATVDQQNTAIRARIMAYDILHSIGYRQLQW